MSEYRYLSPEKVYVNLNLAGVGARFAACFIDNILKLVLIAFIAAVIIMVILIVAAFNAGWARMIDIVLPRNEWWLVIPILGAFFIFYGYHIFFETVWNGQTPGKRLIKIRVVQESGSSVTFTMVLIRNLLRLIDELPMFYAIGILSVLISRRNQRLGDIAAGTIVIRAFAEGAPATLAEEIVTPHRPGAASFQAFRPEEQDFAVLKKYLQRRESMNPEEIQVLDRKLADFFAQKYGIDPGGIGSPDDFLREVAANATQGIIK